MFKQQHSDQHQRIVAAIAGRNPEGANDAMQSHLSTIIAALQAAPGSPQFSELGQETRRSLHPDERAE